MRRSKPYTIAAEGRDKGKVFVLTEMSAARAEKWAIRAILALAHAGADIPADLASRGWEALAVMGIEALGKMTFGDAEPLLDEMFECVRFRPDPANPDYVREPNADDVEEVETRVRLRMEVFLLHTGFSRAGAGSTSTPGSAEPPKAS